MTDQLGIVELSRVCTDMRARNLELFEQIGAWVATTADGDLQRLFAEACHRHAWHAELWQRRTPAISIVPDPAPSARPVPDVDVDADADVGARRREHYRRALAVLRDDLDALRLRVDPTLDPSSRRTIDLIAGDLSDLVERLDASVC